jgi:hypothetical protein
MALAEKVRGRPRHHDAKDVIVRTAPGGADRHVHCALWDANGCGETSPGSDGHVHRVQWGRLIPMLGHTHDISGTRCELAHDHQLQHKAEA